MAVYGYVRVSTLAQAEEGISLGVQQRTLEGYAMMQGVALGRMFVEHGVSGSIPLAERPEGAAMLAALQPGDTIMTPKLDRMFRSASDALAVLERVKALGCSLHMIDLGGDVVNNGISKLVFTILSAVAEAERDRIRERIATVKADQRKQGLYLGGRVPFGYTVTDGRLAPVEAEQAAIRRMRAMKAHGATLRAIQDDVNVSFGRRVSLDAISRICAETN
jgi:DNA invertase Pin-like site-specific DNA recombinase